MCENKVEIGNCHQCGEETDWVCERCDDWVCEGCTVKYTLHNQVDYTCCTNCYEGRQQRYAEYMYKEEQKAKEKRRLKDLRNKKQREWYNSPRQVKKRKSEKLIRIIMNDVSSSLRLKRVFQNINF